MTQKVLAKLISFAGCDKLGLFKIAIASSCLMIVPQGQVRAASIPIINSSFEDPVAPVQPDGYYSINSITGWSLSSTGINPPLQGVLDPTKSQILTGNDFFYNLQPVPDGDQVGYLNGGNITQTLSAVLQANTRYTLGAEVGRRKGVIFPGYNIELLAGSTVIASNSSITPAEATFAPVTVNYTSGSSSPLIGQTLTIRLSSLSVPGGQTNFDKITLDASPIPEPSAILGLLGFGLLGIASTLKQK